MGPSADKPKTHLEQNELVELERIRANSKVKIAESRSKVLQVIFGTMIVGVAAAAFPFAQRLAEVSTQERIEQIKRDAQIEVLTKENTLKKELAKWNHELVTSQVRRNFLNSLAHEARSENIGTRIILAEFFAHLGEEPDKWETFLNYLIERQKLLNIEREILAGPDAARANRLKQIERLESPNIQAFEPSTCDISNVGPPKSMSLVDGLILGIQKCLGPTSPLLSSVEYIVIHHTAGSSLQGDTRVVSAGRDRLRGPLAHFVIGRDGTLIQTARTTHVAKHIGRAKFQGTAAIGNSNTIGVQFSGFSNSDNSHYTEVQIQTGVILLRELLRSFGLPLDRIVGHDEVAGPLGRKVDPGPLFPWDRVRSELRISEDRNE